MPTRIYLAEILAATAARYGMTVEEISIGQKRENVEPRQVAIYLCRQLTSVTLPALAIKLHQHHTTILHGERKIKRLRAEKPELDALIVSLIAELSAARAA
jgi:chromosomal replication initiator protein